jgi:hypothetical protein
VLPTRTLENHEGVGGEDGVRLLVAFLEEVRTRLAALIAHVRGKSFQLGLNSNNHPMAIRECRA